MRQNRHVTPINFIRLYYSALCVAGCFVLAAAGFAPWVMGHGLNLDLFFRDPFANLVSTFLRLTGFYPR
jgi:hypothetical protein